MTSDDNDENINGTNNYNNDNCKDTISISNVDLNDKEDNDASE